MSFVPWSEAAPKVIEAARRALELDPSVPQAHYAMGIARWYEGNWAECEREFQLAVDLNPNYAGARATYSHLLNILKRPQAARTQIDRALQVDPYNAFLQAFNGTDLLFERRWDDAIDQLRTALKMSPGLPLAANSLIAALHMKGSYPEAVDALKTYAEIMGYTEVEQRLQRRGAGDDYRQTMRQAADDLVVRSRRTYVSRYDIVMFYTYAGELDRAFEWIEKGIESRDPNLPYLLEPDFEPLHGDPRFRAVMRRLNLPLTGSRQPRRWSRNQAGRIVAPQEITI